MTRLVGWAAVGVGVIVEVILASFTRPFTWPAEVVVTIAFAGLVTVVLVQRFVPTAPSPITRRQWLLPARVTTRHRGSRWELWLIPLAAVVAWELFSYFGMPRSSHPTLSSMLDSVDSTHLGRGIAFTSWLALGWYLVTR